MRNEFGFNEIQKVKRSDSVSFEKKSNPNNNTRVFFDPNRDTSLQNDISDFLSALKHSMCAQSE
jgi:hypothetical protein